MNRGRLRLGSAPALSWGGEARSVCTNTTWPHTPPPTGSATKMQRDLCAYSAWASKPGPADRGRAGRVADNRGRPNRPRASRVQAASSWAGSVPGRPAEQIV